MSFYIFFDEVLLAFTISNRSKKYLSSSLISVLIDVRSIILILNLHEWSKKSHCLTGIIIEYSQGDSGYEEHINHLFEMTE